ncbi:MAG: 1-phosphofructokinase family hexose kinase [Verrucomicrobiota bacterium]
MNPSIDAEWRVTDVLWEEKNNVQSERRWAGGKGINVARWLKHLGGNPQLLLPLGGQPGEELAGYLRGEKISAQVVALRETTRVNVIVTTEAGRQIRLNPLGPKLTVTEWRNFLRAFQAGLKRANLLVLSGSLPRGLSVDVYARLIRLAHRVGVRVLLDCDGAPFKAAVTARPFLVKPNEHELALWWGRRLGSESRIVAAARALSRQTGGWVIVSRGGDRSLLVNVTEDFQLFAAPPKLKPRNTVGAGDAMLAAVARQIQLGAAPEAWLLQGLTIGSQATQMRAGDLPEKI